VAKKKSKPPLLGQITFRLPPQVHQELLDIARHLNLDLTSLLNLMLGEARPTFLERATEIARRQAQAKKDLEAVALPIPGATPEAIAPLVKVAMDAARLAPADDKWTAMLEAVWPHLQGRGGGLLLPMILHEANKGLREEEDRREVEEAMRRWEERAADRGPDDEP
jgi:hypothetical protein